MVVILRYPDASSSLVGWAVAFAVGVHIVERMLWLTYLPALWTARSQGKHDRLAGCIVEECGEVAGGGLLTAVLMCCCSAVLLVTMIAISGLFSVPIGPKL
jgi:hypothetical protein